MPAKKNSNFQRSVKADFIRKAAKPKVSHEITCHHCGQYSGYDNDALASISSTMQLKCRNCGKVCIRAISNKGNARTMGEELHLKANARIIPQA